MIAALPLIFEAITGLPKLLSAGKSVYEAVTGEASTAETPEALQAEVEALPPEQQQAFVDRMETEIKRYRAETERLINEQGVVDENITGKLSQAAADAIAKMRMMTRPLVVRMMARAMVWPVMYLFLIDGSLALANTLLAGFRVTIKDGEAEVLLQFQLIAGQFFSSDSAYTEMYATLVPWAAGVVMTYMTLRQFEKKKGDASPVAAISGAMNGIAQFIGGLRK